MPKAKAENMVVLGYHSPTEWVFFPEVVALYDIIVINCDVFDKTVDEGKNSPSAYKTTKAELLKELQRKGILVAKKYPVEETQQKQLDEIVKYFFMHHENEIRQLLIYAFETFIKHEKDTLEKLVNPNDPHWNDVVTQLPRLEQTKAALTSGASLSDFPQQRSIAKRYFEDSILTPIAFQSGYNPVFQWEGYARFEQFLLSFRRGTEAQRKAIQKGAELRVLKSVSDVILPFRTIRSSDSIERVINKWNAFEEIRQYITKLNHRMWEMIGACKESSDAKQKEFIDDFNSMLDLQMKNLNTQIHRVDLEVEKEQVNLFSRITRFIIATLGSIVPGTGGFGQVLDDAYMALVKKQVRERYPALNAVFEYERILGSLVSSAIVSAPMTTFMQEYKPVEYWDRGTDVD